jgi:hypothetical protein
MAPVLGLTALHVVGGVVIDANLVDRIGCLGCPIWCTLQRIRQLYMPDVDEVQAHNWVVLSMHLGLQELPHVLNDHSQHSAVTMTAEFKTEDSAAGKQMCMLSDTRAKRSTFSNIGCD